MAQAARDLREILVRADLLGEGSRIWSMTSEGSHRVIPGYLVQTGDPNSKDFRGKGKWGLGGPGYTLPAEIGAKHVQGAVAMACDNSAACTVTGCAPTSSATRAVAGL